MSSPPADSSAADVPKNARPPWLAKALRVEWLGQMGASLFWICSVLSYGITSTGDVLQMLAAVSWLVANLASLAPTAPDPVAG